MKKIIKALIFVVMISFLGLSGVIQAELKNPSK